MYTYKDYEQSDATKAAGAALADHDSSKPAAYSSQYTTQLKNLQDQISNRKPFSYDVNGDALYQQYKQQYTQQGKQAMKDTIGQAAGLTGGYGNSYGQAVGQQQYNAYLQNLNDVIPELYNQALSKYQTEGEDLYNQYSLYNTAENQDYSRWADQLNQWNTDRSYLADRYDTERNLDYNIYSNDRSYYQDIADTMYSRLTAMMENYGYNPTDDELAQAGMTRDEANAILGLGDYAVSGDGEYYSSTDPSKKSTGTTLLDRINSAMSAMQAASSAVSSAASRAAAARAGR